jgi:hypothetical protein
LQYGLCFNILQVTTRIFHIIAALGPEEGAHSPSWPNGLIIIIIIYSHPSFIQNWPVLRPTIVLIVLYSVRWGVYSAAAAAAVKLGTQGAGATEMSSSFLRSGPSVQGGLYLVGGVLGKVL